MADQDTKPELDTISPIIASAAGNSVDVAKMASTPAAKQGVAGIASPFTNKGNIHETPSSTSVWQKPMAPATEAPATAQTGITDAERARLVQTKRDVLARDREAAQEQLKASATVSQLGGIGRSIQAQLSANLNNIFNAKETSLMGEGLAAVGASKELLGQISESDAVKSAVWKTKDATGKDITLQGKDAVSAIFQQISAADKELDTLTDAKKGTPEYLVSETKMNEAIAALTTSLNKEGGNTLAWDAVANIFPDKEKLLGTLASTALADKITVDDTLLNDLYGTRTETIGPDGKPVSTLEVTADDAAEIKKIKEVLKLTGTETVSELRARMDAYLNTEYKAVVDLETQLRDPTLTPSERADTLNQLRDMGYTGTLVARNEVDSAAADVEATGDETFTFLGEERTLAEALDDNTVMGAVSDYLSGKLDRAELPPVLADFIDNNQKIFESALIDMEQEVTNYNDVQGQWNTLKSLKLAPAIMTALGYKEGQPIQTARLNPDKMPLVKEIIAGTNPANNVLMTDLSAAGLSTENLTTVLQNLDADELKQLRENAAVRTQYLDTIKTHQNLANTYAKLGSNPSMTGVDVLSGIFGTGDTAELSDILGTLKELTALGIPGAQEGLNALNAIGSMDNAKEMLDALSGKMDKSKLGDLIPQAGAAGILGDTEGVIAKLKAAIGSTKGLKDRYKKLLDLTKSTESDKVDRIANALKTFDDGRINSKDFNSRSSFYAQMFKNNPEIKRELELRDIAESPTLQSINTFVAEPNVSWNGLLADAAGTANMRSALAQAKSIVASPTASPEAKAKAQELVSSVTKSFVDKRKPYSWGDVLGKRQALGLWKPPAGKFPPEMLTPSGALKPIKGTLDKMGGGTMEYGHTPAVQDLTAAIATFAEFIGEKDLARAADLYVSQLPDAPASAATTMAKASMNALEAAKAAALKSKEGK